MIIHTPEITNDQERSTISARIELENRTFPAPKKLWYSFPKACETDLLIRGDPFLAGTIMTAMALKEDIEIRPPVSPKLIDGLYEFQNLMVIWFPKNLKKVIISTSNLEAISPDYGGRETASLFSGGVDSSFILKANLAPEQPMEVHRVQHALYIHGADIPLNKSIRFNELYNLCKNPLEQVGVNLIPCATNVRAFVEGLFKWDYSHGAGLISTGIALSGLIKRLYIASSFNYRGLVPWGSSPLLDHWLSTESLEVVHVGASYRRTEKVRVIANWKPAQEYLRVCPNIDNSGSVNCERCDKCLSTKVIFWMEGELEKIKTFNRPFQTRDFLRWVWICNPHSNIPQIILRQAIVDRRWKVIPFAILVSFSRLIRYWLDRWMPSVLRRRLRNRYFPLERNPFFAPNLPDRWDRETETLS